MKEATNELFDFLGKQGLKVLENKFKLVEREVKYLGHGETWRELKLQPEWDGLFQVLLTTETAVRTAEKGWTRTWVKASVNPDTRETALTKTFKVKTVKTIYCKPLTSS